MTEETQNRLIELATAILDEVRAIRVDLNRHINREDDQKAKLNAEATERILLREAIRYKDKSSEDKN